MAVTVHRCKCSACLRNHSYETLSHLWTSLASNNCHCFQLHSAPVQFLCTRLYLRFHAKFEFCIRSNGFALGQPYVSLCLLLYAHHRSICGSGSANNWQCLAHSQQVCARRCTLAYLINLYELMNMLHQSPSFYVFHKGYYVSKLGQSLSLILSRDDIKINKSVTVFR